MGPLITPRPIPYRTVQTDNGTKRKQSLIDNPIFEESNFRLRTSRLDTFDNWPNQQVSKSDLANAGFVYTGRDDIVICPVCHIEGRNWVSGDDPLEDHRSWNPNCSFVRNNNLECDNPEIRSRNLDTCGKFGIVLPNSIPEDCNPINLKKLGIQIGKVAKHQDKITINSRLATFENWPKSIKQTPEELAEAGFFYTGTGDQILCFHCDGGLQDWEQDDDPWEQHALWFSACMFLNLKKGKDFIEKVKRKFAKFDPDIASSSNQLTKEEIKSELKLSPEREAEITDKTLCKICYKNEKGVVFLPCGHIVACADCASALKTCAVCREPLQAVVRAYLS